MSIVSDNSEWDMLEVLSASDWEVLSNLRWAPSSDDDARSVVSAADSEMSTSSLCTALGWPGLAPRATGQQAPTDRMSYKEALLAGGGGIDGVKAAKMARGPEKKLQCFVNGYRRGNCELPVIHEEPDADEEYWLRKGQGSLLALRRWRFDRRPGHCNPERRAGIGRQQPTWEYESGQTAAGYCLSDCEEDDEPL
eukprot:CAMPEP_0181472292 /NCGR_PEP_ID=MMETSP1110-20121109/39524_1 /TAXON_ID=174948 /ORGANISM="Symbiodinium sp., Strain CCMP421" /LENGTH=194 /DNA_ID=CAMNT_0023597355 /DNA_START=87 /DNA_END=671 /DNA_ORIENTATION=-